MPALRLTEIWIYPVKSLGGIRLGSSPVLEKGLPFDRRWMLIDGNNLFMTQRVHPQLALFGVTLTGSGLLISYEGSSIAVPFRTKGMSLPVQASVWDDKVEVLETNPQISRWFSERLGMDCRLVFFPESNSRPVDPRFRNHLENVSLADAYPFLIIGEASLRELSRRMGQNLPMNRFRPNFVFSGGQPNEEDNWIDFRIGKNRFRGVKPCSRCVVTTVDQATAQKGVQPLLALSRYRKRDGNVYFGQNVIALDHYEISEGDEIILD